MLWPFKWKLLSSYKVILSFIWCYHLNETSSAKYLYVSICFKKIIEIYPWSLHFFFYFDLANFCAVLNGLAPWFSSIDQWLCGVFFGNNCGVLTQFEELNLSTFQLVGIQTAG